MRPSSPRPARWHADARVAGPAGAATSAPATRRSHSSPTQNGNAQQCSRRKGLMLDAQHGQAGLKSCSAAVSCHIEVCYCFGCRSEAPTSPRLECRDEILRRVLTDVANETRWDLANAALKTPDYWQPGASKLRPAVATSSSPTPSYPVPPTITGVGVGVIRSIGIGVRVVRTIGIGV